MTPPLARRQAEKLRLQDRMELFLVVTAWRNRLRSFSGRAAPLWHEAQETPEAQLVRARDSDAIRNMIAALTEPFRETFVLREIQNNIPVCQLP